MSATNGLEYEVEPFVEGDGRGNGQRQRGTASFSNKESPPPNLADNAKIFQASRTFSLRHLIMVGSLAALTVVFVKRIGGAMSDFDPADTEAAPPHHGGFHEGKPKARPLAGAGIHGAKAPLPKIVQDSGDDAAGGSEEFMERDYGFYDISLTSEFDQYSDISPYADPRLAMSDDERHKEMKDWNEKMDEIREKYGYWNFHDSYPEEKGKHRPEIDFSKAGPLRDVSSAELPQDAWQSDQEYVNNFLKEARELVHRVQEGIYEEYGHGLPLTDEEKELRKHNFRIATMNLTGVTKDLFRDSKKFTKLTPVKKAISWMAEGTFEALARKLLHAMITNDDFYVVLGGHSSAAGHGNNFHESYMMQFHEIMEPVFDRLGMRLISRNSAQGGVGTVQTAMAGSGIYGDSDIIIWDSSMTEGDPGAHDLFYRQAILSGDRVPIVLGNMAAGFVHTEAGAWVGELMSIWDGEEFIGKTEDLVQAKTLPWYVQGLYCGKDWDPCNSIKYDAVCWVNRTDVHPPEKQMDQPKGKASWHPGFRNHRWTGHKLALVVLLGLQSALDQWEDIAYSEGSPLPDEYWHLTEEYAKIRGRVANRDLPDASPCEESFSFMPRICKVGMKGATEWTPHAGPSIRSLLKPAPNGYVPTIKEKNLYDGVEVKPPNQRVPFGVVDVYAIASALPKSTSDDLENRGRKLKLHVKGKSGKKIWKADHGKINRFESNSDSELERLGSSHLDAGARSLAEGDPMNIVPGQGWDIQDFKTGTCDGTYHSECDRRSRCVMWGANDGRGFLIGDGLSGWLVMELKDLKEGIIIVMMQDGYQANFNRRTEGWAEVNNGKTYEGPAAVPTGDTNTTGSATSTPGVGSNRNLGSVPEREVPDDFIFDFAINGKITTLDKAKFLEQRIDLTNLLKVWVLLDDTSVVGDVEVALRVRQPGRDAPLGVSHIYWA